MPDLTEKLRFRAAINGPMQRSEQIKNLRHVLERLYYLGVTVIMLEANLWEPEYEIEFGPELAAEVQQLLDHPAIEIR